jgi:putative transposase
MSNYRRRRVAGASYFFTVNLHDRRNALLVEHIDLLRSTFRAVRQSHPFVIDAIVVLPEHLHCIWTLPPEDVDYSTRWRLIKSEFSRALPSIENRSISRLLHKERGIWQRRFWEHAIRDDEDFANHVDYIHFNPVKHGLVPRPIEWPHSSLHSYAKRGVLPAEWGANGIQSDLDLE